MGKEDEGRNLHRQLREELMRAGCFRRAPMRSFVFGAFLLASYACAYSVLLAAPAPLVRAAALVTLAFISVQAGFLAHEAGHGAITRRRRLAAGIGQVFNTLLTGLSFSYFSHIHRLHHPHTNERVRDPDMQSGFFSMYAQSAAAKRGLGALITRHQAVLIWILVSLQAFSLKIDSLRHVLARPRTTRADQAMLLAHAVLWLAVPAAVLGAADAALNYVLVTWIIGPYLGTIFLVNHIGTRVVEPGEPVAFLEHELGATRNLGTGRVQDVLFGGLNNHVEHHLFPAVPSARLPLARRITRAFCHRHGLAYREMSWLQAAREVTRHFSAMSSFAPAPWRTVP